VCAKARAGQGESVKPNFREFWQAWSHDERYYQIRRFNFGLGTPVLIVFMIVMLVLQAWLLAALSGAVAIIGAIGLLRTPWQP
jgi:small-conductance mechanosensitive channel